MDGLAQYGYGLSDVEGHNRTMIGQGSCTEASGGAAEHLSVVVSGLMMA